VFLSGANWIAPVAAKIRDSCKCSTTIMVSVIAPPILTANPALLTSGIFTVVVSATAQTVTRLKFWSCATTFFQQDDVYTCVGADLSKDIWTFFGSSTNFWKALNEDPTCICWAAGSPRPVVKNRSILRNIVSNIFSKHILKIRKVFFYGSYKTDLETVVGNLLDFWLSYHFPPVHG
jgi:hypothetical protein